MKKRLFAFVLMFLMVISSWSVSLSVCAYDEESYSDEESYLDEENYSDEESLYDPDSYIKEGIQTEYNSQPEVTEKEEGVAYPVHDFSYDALDMKASLLSGDYYNNENAYFKDEARVFDDDTYYKDFQRMIQKAADELEINIGVFLGGLYRSDETTEQFTENAIKTLFNMDWDQNSVFLYLDFEGRSLSYDYICTCHDAKLYYPNSGLNDRIEDIIQHMYKYLPSSGHTIYKKDVRTAIEVFISDLKKNKQKGPVWDSYYHNDEKDCYRYVLFGSIIDQSFRPFKYWYVFLLIGIALGLLVGAISSSSIRKKYKFREIQKASAYTSKNLIRFNEVRDQFLREHTTSVYIPPSSSSGGGGGSHGGGGGSFGGGGGHR